MLMLHLSLKACLLWGFVDLENTCGHFFNVNINITMKYAIV